MAAIPYVYAELDSRTITGNVAYSALAALFALPAHVDQLEVSLNELAGNVPLVRVYGQRVSDNLWVPLADTLSPAASDAESTGPVDVMPGIYDNIAYRISGNGGLGVTIAFVVRVNSEAP